MPAAPARHLTSIVRTALRGFLRGLFRAWVMVVPLLVALSLIRLGQLLYFWPSGYHASGGDIEAVLFQGLRFDLKVSAVVGFLFLLVLPWASSRLHRWLVGGVALVLGHAVAGQPALLRVLQNAH